MRFSEMPRKGKFLVCTEDEHDYLFWCPGCDTYHGIRDKQAKGSGAKWDFNGDMEGPTFEPSYLTGMPKSDGKGNIERFAIQRCHSYIRNGMIEFLSDCHHKLAGQTVPLPNLPFEQEEEGDGVDD